MLIDLGRDKKEEARPSLPSKVAAYEAQEAYVMFHCTPNVKAILRLKKSDEC